MISVIIPAHNESSVIARCLSAILSDAHPDELEVIVVCNGCNDNTAEVVKSFNKDIKIIETDVPSKSNALNLGDRCATGYPRFYVDADVIVPLDSIRKTATALQNDGVFAAAPLMHVDCSNRSYFIKAFYRVWLALPYCRQGMIGSGVYALNQGGRERFNSFPPIIADDGYVRLLFQPHERVTVDSCKFTIIPPVTLQGLMNIKTRAHFGNLELAGKYPELLINDKTVADHSLQKIVFNPGWWAAFCIYCYVKIIARIRAHRSFQKGVQRHWDRDETSR